MKKMAFWGKHIKDYKRLDGQIVKIRRIFRDFKEFLEEKEKNFFYIQERYNYLATPKLSAFLSQNDKIKLNESKDLLRKKNIDHIILNHLLNSNY